MRSGMLPLLGLRGPIRLGLALGLNLLAVTCAVPDFDGDAAACPDGMVLNPATAACEDPPMTLPPLSQPPPSLRLP